MSMQVYYVTWHTWSDQQVNTPWEFWFLNEGVTLKRRSHVAAHVLIPTTEQIKAAWESQNTQLLDDWDSQFVSDVKLAAFVSGESESHAQSQVTQLFADAQFDKCVPVTSEIKQQIQLLFDRTLSQSKRQAV